MLVKTKTDYSKSGGNKTFRSLTKDLCWSKLTRNMQVSSYSRMDDSKEKSKKMKKSKAEEKSKGKENDKTLANKESKEKKGKKKGWKRVRQAALSTCKYIGLGAAHLSPATMYISPEYSADPRYWNRSFSSSYKPRGEPKTPHWTDNMMFSQW